MAKRSASSARGKRAAKSATRTPEGEIDFSDIPELTGDQLKRARRVGRPLLGRATRKLIAIRMDPDVLSALRKEATREGIGYQTLIHRLLSEHVKPNA